MTKDLPHSLTRSLVIRAPREVVFRYFTDSERFASWWGEGSTIDGRIGGTVHIRYPNEIVARGEVTRLEPDRAIAFTYGYESSQPELPPGSSLVTIELFDDPAGTRLELRHELTSEGMRDQHVAGWRYQLSVFANVVARAHHGDLAAMLDRWFQAWSEADAANRGRLLAACATDDVAMHDSYSCVTGRGELEGHITNYRVHMPGISMQRDGEPKHCQGTVIVGWTASDPAGTRKAQGTNVIELAPDGRIARVVGFW